MKKTFEVKVVRTAVIKVEIDTDVVNSGWFCNFQKYFRKLFTNDKHKELAEYIAKIACNGFEYVYGIGRIEKVGTIYTNHQREQLAKGFRITDDEREFAIAETIKLKITN